MYYIGSHWGTEDDGYVCSSNRMRDAYRRRPLDFKRRILAKVYSNRKDLLDEEQKWFDRVKNKDRYYNLNWNVIRTMWWTDENGKALDVRQTLSLRSAWKGKKKGPLPEEVKAKIRSKHVFLDPTGIRIDVDDLPKFCSLHGLHYVAMTKISKGTYGRRYYKGWSKFVE